MLLEEFKKILNNVQELKFELESGEVIAKHFHITEIGQVDKKFIDCGGTIRFEQKINFQLWIADDTSHRLLPKKIIEIINLFQEKIVMVNNEIEIEYQGDSIQKFGLKFDGEKFILTTKKTDCLAKDKCGTQEEKKKANQQSYNNCSSSAGCC